MREAFLEEEMEETANNLLPTTFYNKCNSC